MTNFLCNYVIKLIGCTLFTYYAKIYTYIDFYYNFILFPRLYSTKLLDLLAEKITPFKNFVKKYGVAFDIDF